MGTIKKFLLPAQTPLQLTAPPVDGGVQALSLTLTPSDSPVELFYGGTHNGKNYWSNDGTSPANFEDTINGSLICFWQNGSWRVVSDGVILLDASAVSTATTPAGLQFISDVGEPLDLTLTGGTPFPATPAAALGQTAIVTTINASGTFRDVWTCVRLDPVKWNPPGQIARSLDGTLYRAFVSDAGIPSTELAYP